MDAGPVLREGRPPDRFAQRTDIVFHRVLPLIDLPRVCPTPGITCEARLDDVPTQLVQHDLLVPSEIWVELQTISVRISYMELARAPRSVTNLGPVEIGASDRELFEEFIDARNHESVRWSIALTKVLGL